MSSSRWQRLTSKRHHKKSQLKEIQVHNSNMKKSTKKKNTGWLTKLKQAKTPRWLRFLNKPIVKYGLIFISVAILLSIGLLLKELPSPRRLTAKDNFAVSSQIFDRHGTLLYEIYGQENRIPVDLDKLPPHVLQATIAIEDKNFYHHWGFDLRGIVRAVRNNLTSQNLEGGSTITQQLVKNAFLTREKTLQRKAKELVLSILTELIYSKDEILELYLNYIAYGGPAVGIEAASQQYFDKSAQDLSLAEASLLAGLPQAPTRYSPFAADPTVSKQRQSDVLRRMAEDGYITEAQAEEARSVNLNFALSQTDIKAPHFVFYIRDKLYEEYGTETVEKGGLRVTTSLDLNLQEVAQASLSAEIAELEGYRVSNGAALITKPKTGEVLAMIGSKDYFDSEIDGQVNVTLRPRQPGSSIKPLMYATTFQEKTLNPGSLLLDIPTCFEIPGQPNYCPKNYDGTYKGPVTVRRSLGNSLNIPAVKSLSTIGVETFMQQAEKMGITTWHDPVNYGLSLTLGGGEVKMIEMAEAFAVLANQGIRAPLTPILKVEDYTGEVLMEVDLDKKRADYQRLMEFDQQSAGDLKRVMDRAPAYLTAHIMQDNQARVEAFGANSSLVIPNQIVSAKTGTTNDLKDNWTIGFTPEYLVATWVGNNDNTPMNPYLVSGITGAAPIWNDLMSYLLQGKESVWPEKPTEVAQGPVCPNGLAPNHPHLKTEEANCSPWNNDLFWLESEPSTSEIIQKEVWIKPESGLPPAYGEEIEGLILENHTLYQDPVTELYCGDCVRPTNEEGKVQYEQHVVRYQSTTNE